jgi:retron-type reverse transcriptase
VRLPRLIGFHTFSPQSKETARATSLLQQIAEPDTLREAWRRVRANKGGPGADGVTIEGFATDLDRLLDALAAAILNETYRPGRLLRRRIAKPEGGWRSLAIPGIADRVAQTAALIVLGPDLDRRMSSESFAYRTGRGVDTAIAAVEAAFGRGLIWTLHSDVASFLDPVSYCPLVDEAHANRSA